MRKTHENCCAIREGLRTEEITPHRVAVTGEYIGYGKT